MPQSAIRYVLAPSETRVRTNMRLGTIDHCVEMNVIRGVRDNMTTAHLKIIFKK